MTADVDPVHRVGPWREERTGSGSDAPARWVPIGTRSSGVSAMVDPAGLVGPVGAGWSLDWWVGAEDRWHVPAREPAVRQGLVEQSPVVETRVRVPGGDIVHRVHAAQGPAALGGREAIVVELTNETPVPVAVAVAVRPYAVDAGGSLHQVVPRDQRTIGIDGAWSLLADRDARNMAGGGGGTDPFAIVAQGDASARWPTVVDERGRASFALVFPLPHTASMRVALVAGDPPDDTPSALAGLSGAAAVASGWARQADHGVQVVLPDEPLAGSFTAARRRLLLGAPDLADTAVGTEQALVAGALAVLGHHDDLRPVVGALLGRQQLNGAIPDEAGSEAATGAALAALGWWQRHDPRPELLAEVMGPVAKAAHRIDRRRRRRRHRGDPARDGLLPAGPQPAEIAGPTTAYLDDWWSAAGFVEASALLERAGQSPSAAEADQAAGMMLDDVDRSAATVGSTLATDVVPVGPERPVDEGIVGLLPALAPLAVVDGTADGAAHTLDRIRAELVGEDGSVSAGAAGDVASPWLTACLALYELTRGDPRALDRLDWLLRAGGPTASWPRRLDGRGVGHGGQGDDPVATALFVQLVRAVLLCERRPAPAAQPVGLDLLPVMPPSWLGQGIEIHDAPTSFGRFGFAVRWHGERPALLWELEAAPSAAVPTIACPGLAPGWTTTEPVGETLLPAPETPPGGPAAAIMDDDVSFS